MDASMPLDCSLILIQVESRHWTESANALMYLRVSLTGLLEYNTLVSGSKSTPTSSATYDDITRKTAFIAIDAFASKLRSETVNIVFCQTCSYLTSDWEIYCSCIKKKTFHSCLSQLRRRAGHFKRLFRF